MLIQRVIEFLISLPTIPIWMGLAAAVPLEWPAVRVYFMITVILSIVGWAGLARVVRGKILSLREEDYVRAAVISGSGDMAVILRHLLPAFLSYLIVHLTLAIPGMILGETSLSFLGLGLRPPVISWGVLLNEAQNVKAIYTDVWLLIPVASSWLLCSLSTSLVTACGTRPTPTAKAEETSSKQELAPGRCSRYTLAILSSGPGRIRLCSLKNGFPPAGICRSDPR